MSNPAIAFFNWGRWVADCPKPGCGNALELERGQADFVCRTRNGVGACATSAPVQWPTDPGPAEVEAALGGRSEAGRSWRPGEELHP